MRIAIKYGAIIAVGVAIWVLADHYLVHISRSRVAFLTPLFFNLLQLVILFIGIRVRRQQNKGKLALGQGISSGLAISVAYGVFACIFFLAFYLIVGSKMLENESTGGNNQPERNLLLGAFAGLLFTAVVGGLLYSTVISFAIRPVLPAGTDRQSGSAASRSRRRR